MGVLDERQPLLKFAGLGLLDGDLRVGVRLEGVRVRLEWMCVLFEGVGVLFEWMCVLFEWMCVSIQSLFEAGVSVGFNFVFEAGVSVGFNFVFEPFHSVVQVDTFDDFNLWWLRPNRCFEGRKVS